MLEDNLRTLFTLEAAADQPPSQISVPAAGGSARMRQRLQRALTIGSPLLAAAAVIVVIATSVGLSGVAFSGGGERIARPTRTAMPPAAAGSASWTRIPRAPIAPRSEYAAVWTGKEMIVWGSSLAAGYVPGLDGVNYGHNEGFAYDPATGRWSTLPASPLGSAGRNLMLAVRSLPLAATRAPDPPIWALPRVIWWPDGPNPVLRLSLAAAGLVTCVYVSSLAGC